MRKLMLLASLVALAALTLVATPAFAQEDGDKVDVCHFPGGNPANAHVINIDRSALDAHLEENELDFVVEEGDECPPDDGNGEPPDDGDDDGDDNGDDNNNVIRDDDRFRFNNVGNFDFSPSFEASQETEQECDTGEVDQDINVTGGGENSIQTVGLQPTAVTGCAQNAVGVLAADPIFAAQGGDTAFNFDDTNVILDDDCDGNDDDGDGNRDEDGDCDGNDDGDNGNHNGNDCEEININGLVICDGNGNHNGDDNGDDNGDNVVDIDDDDDFRFGGDRLNINGGGGLEELELDDISASIDASPSLVVNGGGTIEQAAAASSTTVLPKWWV